MSLLIKSLAFHSLPDPLFEQTPDVQTGFEQLVPVIEQQTRDVVACLADDEKKSIERHFLCSTMIELPFTSGALQWNDIRKNIRKDDIPMPCTYVNAYECASWGYSLRYFLTRPSSRYLLVSILDANLMDFEFWRHNENWGHSGFGLCTLLLEADDSAMESLTTGCATTYNSTAEFATIIRRHMMSVEDVTLALPFFPDHIRQIFTRMLNGSPQLPDLHEQYGHCFGSDPWLTILQHGLDNTIQEQQDFLACSIALNGYFSMAQVSINSDTQLLFQKSERLPS
ncbi:hypothetical protein [Pleionea sp. CnH1-48]|uniref:hypothetical protein n=1 Tax=Pleionea sp. CnH1-48 TaxID=2954494 RepID=UPI00209834BC|nr:hypothetical protein [Pleionea sp. CnH1-48]MCO7225538.1 hypothetical protein [Pleionea sp. CnH1-48]